MTICKLKVLINGLINMIDNGAREDEKLDEHQKGYNEGYRAALQSISRNCILHDDESIIDGRKEVEDWLKAKGYKLVGKDVGDNDELWTRVKDCIVFRLRWNSVKVSSACGINANCGYDDVRISESGTLCLGDSAWVYPPEEEEN